MTQYTHCMSRRSQALETQQLRTWGFAFLLFVTARRQISFVLAGYVQAFIAFILFSEKYVHFLKVVRRRAGFTLSRTFHISQETQVLFRPYEDFSPHRALPHLRINHAHLQFLTNHTMVVGHRLCKNSQTRADERRHSLVWEFRSVCTGANRSSVRSKSPKSL